MLFKEGKESCLIDIPLPPFSHGEEEEEEEEVGGEKKEGFVQFFSWCSLYKRSRFEDEMTH